MRRVAPSAVPLALLVGCIVLFGLVALDVEAHGLLARLDPHVVRWSSEHAAGRGTRAWLRGVSRLGVNWLLAIVVVLTMVRLLAARRTLDAAVLGLAGGVVALVTTGLKEAFRRPRPAFGSPSDLPHSFSFPSGHTSGSFALYVLMAYLLTTGRRTRTRVAAIAGAVALAAAVGATRVLLAVHYPTDVIAGACVGLATVGAALLARNAFAARR